MAWVTAAEVEQITGGVVTEPDVARAESVVNIYSGRTSDTFDTISTRDREHLKHASAWQAWYLSSQVDIGGRSSVASVTQDEARVDFNYEWQAVLHPLAARALKNLSWKRTRVVGRRTRVYRDFILESSDPYNQWRI